MSLEYNAISRDDLIAEIQKLPADFMVITMATRMRRKVIDVSGVSLGRRRHVYLWHKIPDEKVKRAKRSQPPDVSWCTE